MILLAEVKSVPWKADQSLEGGWDIDSAWSQHVPSLLRSLPHIPTPLTPCAGLLLSGLLLALLVLSWMRCVACHLLQHIKHDPPLDVNFGSAKSVLYFSTLRFSFLFSHMKKLTCFSTRPWCSLAMWYLCLKAVSHNNIFWFPCCQVQMAAWESFCHKCMSGPMMLQNHPLFVLKFFKFKFVKCEEARVLYSFLWP